MSDSDMAAAAQQPMQLSHEDNKDSSSGSNDATNSTSSNVKAKINSSKRCSEQSQVEITCAMIEEIFGKEEEISRPTFKKRRYRLLDSIYKDTKPLKVRYAKNSCFSYERT